jgi:hypothetical protein
MPPLPALRPITGSPFTGSGEKTAGDAVTRGDWAQAAASLARLAAPARALSRLTIDQLRLLQDAVIRAPGALGGAGTMLQLAIAAELQDKGVPATKIAAGAAFGRLEVTVEERVDGDRAAGTWYAYQIRISFLPDTAVVDADEIAFIQTIRLVETTSGANRDPDERSKRRQTPSAASVDRLGGKRHGWYGMNDDGTGGTMLTVWKRSAPATPAMMRDRASWNQPHTTWQFETMVAGCSGTATGTVFAVVTWGFTVDANLKLTEHARTVTNKPSVEATTAVGKWNAQAAGSVFERNTPGQIPLPALN